MRALREEAEGGRGETPCCRWLLRSVTRDAIKDTHTDERTCTYTEIEENMNTKRSRLGGSGNVRALRRLAGDADVLPEPLQIIVDHISNDAVQLLRDLQRSVNQSSLGLVEMFLSSLCAGWVGGCVCGVLCDFTCNGDMVVSWLRRCVRAISSSLRSSLYRSTSAIFDTGFVGGCPHLRRNNTQPHIPIGHYLKIKKNDRCRNGYLAGGHGRLFLFEECTDGLPLRNSNHCDSFQSERSAESDTFEEEAAEEVSVSVREPDWWWCLPLRCEESFGSCGARSASAE